MSTANSSTTMQQMQTKALYKQKSSLLSLERHMHKKILIESATDLGRMIRGTLRGYDTNLNVVLQDCLIIHENSSNPFSQQITNENHPDVCRGLGSVVLRGQSVATVYGADGTILVQQDQKQQQQDH